MSIAMSKIKSLSVAKMDLAHRPQLPKVTTGSGVMA